MSENLNIYPRALLIPVTMLFRFFKKRALLKDLRAIDLEEFSPIYPKDYETQRYETDFLFGLTKLCRSQWLLPYMASDPRKLFKQLLFVSQKELCQIPIVSFFGSNNGKSFQSKSLAEFSKKLLVLDEDSIYKNPLKFQEEEDFVRNVKSFEDEFKNNPVDAYYFSWSDRLYLANIDRAHTTAAIYR
jgi:hypothetical protein